MREHDCRKNPHESNIHIKNRRKYLLENNNQLENSPLMRFDIFNNKKILHFNAFQKINI